MTAKTEEIKEVVITQEQLDQIDKGTLLMKDLTAPQQEALEKIMSGEVTAPPAPADPAATPAAEDVKPDEKKAEVPKDFVEGTKYKAKADEANTHKQRAEALDKRLAETTAELERLRVASEVKATPTIQTADQAWDDKHQLAVDHRLARLEAQVLAGTKGAQERLESLQKELQAEKEFAEVNDFAERYPELRLNRRFEDANEDYVKFTQALGATAKDMSPVDKYFEDANFRKEMETKGIKPPADYEKLSQILTVFHRRKSMGYPNFDDAYLGYLRESKKLEERFRNSYTNGVEDVVRKIQNNKNETATLEPTGTGSSGFAMTEAQMEAWLKAHPRPVTAAEKEIMAQIEAHIKTHER